MLADLIIKFAAVSFVVLAIAAAASDMLTLRIPNAFVAAMVGSYALLVVGQGPQWSHLIALGIATLVFALGVYAFERNWIGGGDVKFLAAVSLWAGPALVLQALLLITLAGAAMALVAMTPAWQAWRWVTVPLGGTWLSSNRTSSAVPYGVAIAFGGLFVVDKIAELNLL